MRNIVFWDVDTQFDFIDPTGKLYVPGSESIIPTLAQLTALAKAHKVLVISSADAHRPGDPEFEQYPPHCLVGTSGQQKLPETQLSNHYVVPSHPVELPPNLSHYDQLIIEKQEFDVFSNPNIESLLSKLGKPDVVLYGVVTEICVAAAARGLLDCGYSLSVLLDAIYALDSAKATSFLEEVKRRGGVLLNSRELLDRLTANTAPANR